MGLLSEGSALSWEETKKYADHVRKHGIAQFINQWKKLKVRSGDCLRWGDEVEYMLVKLDHEKKTARLMLGASELLKVLQKEENEGKKDLQTLWRPEYAAYMIEGTPGKPYGHRMAHFNMVEANMKHRREEVMKLLGPGETTLSLTSFFRLGCPNFSDPAYTPTPTEGVTRSLFFPDQVIYPSHPRFHTLSRNIRERRGAKVAINIPMLSPEYSGKPKSTSYLLVPCRHSSPGHQQDENTPKPFVEDLSQYNDPGDSAAAAKPDHIYMDAMGFGMGCSCLQMTFQAVNISEARQLYDELTPLCPILMALSAASPIHRGMLADVDCRWNVIAASVDDRTREERGEVPLKENRFLINKSRYDSIDSYLSCPMYNDIDLVYDKDIYQQLRDAGIDELLAKHFAHLFIRDPISLFRENIDLDDETSTDHFENIQSTNWQTMRFKPPPPDSPIGWRVEFRPTEVQLTDFENAAFVVFVVLLTRVILSYRLYLLIPISKVDENIRRAQKHDAVRTQKFYFRKEILTDQSPTVAAECCMKACPAQSKKCLDEMYMEMTIDEIVNGKPNEFPGLIPLMKNYMESVDDCDVDTSCTITQYLSLISKRASGELMTTARYIREFVQNHPKYNKDSVISEEINYDLICECERVTKGESKAPGLLPNYSTKSTEQVPKAMKKAENLLSQKTSQQNNMNERCSETL